MNIDEPQHYEPVTVRADDVRLEPAGVIIPGADNDVVLRFPKQSFAIGGSPYQIQRVEGFYITRKKTGDVVHRERFETGPYHVVAGDSIVIAPWS